MCLELRGSGWREQRWGGWCQAPDSSRDPLTALPGRVSWSLPPNPLLLWDFPLINFCPNQSDPTPGVRVRKGRAGTGHYEVLLFI